MLRLLLSFLLVAPFCLSLPFPTAAQTKAPAPAPAAIEFFEARVRPVLAENCFACHGPKKQSAGLRLDAREHLLQGGDNGPVVFPGQAEKSPLIKAISHSGPVKMPPKGKLSAQAIEALTAWVRMGVPWPQEKVAASPGADADAWKKHWAFQPIADPEAPRVKDALWPASSLDRFILATLEEKGLTPSAEAERRTLLRRASFDLIGLPPTPEEVDAFERDPAPDAFAKVVDRLLA